MLYFTYFNEPAEVGDGVQVNLPNTAYLDEANVLRIPKKQDKDKATIVYNNITGEIEVDDTGGYSKMYLTFEAIESGSFAIFDKCADVQYSIDNGTSWVTLANGASTPVIAAGNKIMWKGSNLQGWSFGRFGATGQYNVCGNVMSLLYGDNFFGQKSLEHSYVFLGLFCTEGCGGGDGGMLVSAEHLVLPATTLADNCYTMMFAGCTSLTAVPSLPATTLAYSCYYYMFYGCTSLTTAPALPATTLADYCYCSMFQGCTSLTTAPELPATTLADYCYYYMFYGCTSLNYIKCLATNISATYCTTSWVSGVASTGTFVKDGSMLSWTTGANGIPSGWTVVDA